VIVFIFNSNVFSQNTGTVSFNVTTNRTFQNYDPRNIMAIWITDDSDNFVQTLKKRAANRQQYLYKWIASSSQNTVNAITGATLSSHQTHNLNWNCQDVNGNIVPDGWYKIRCEFTTRNGQGPWTPVDYIRFYKGGDPIDTTFSDFNYSSQLAFSNISLVYSPDVTGVDYLGINPVVSNYHLYQNYPNPFNPTTTIEFDIPKRDGIISLTSIIIYNSIGQVIRNLYRENVSSGKYKVKWNGQDDENKSQPSGIYFFQLISGDIKQTRKMILIR